ncbi:TonB-dependent receptor [Ferrimonas marina]|uniref:Outer membrane receptor proteins, mostly Fe transport n=1 Tax=Ferrimonas marina TaxID=299255 RepID=A0A1M5X710_9GAMM|nr:TonB-dependent receptor [Ferrimonas marina]SHH95579.1 Outer membrane receptor proteins, mostly Fe transport [Ferrimonas marina]
MAVKDNRKAVFTRSPLALAIGSALICANALPTKAVAEEAEGQMEVIEVTATRRVQSIHEIPYNISAVSGEELESKQIVDSVDLLRNVAGITVIDRGYRNSGTTNSIMIRGMNVDSATQGDVALSAVPTVATYIDDTPLYANFVLKDIAQVEVLRGPQGTLYGSGSLAGTVRYLMNKPVLGEFSGQASVNFGQTDGSEGFNLNYDGLVNVPIGEMLAFRANVGKIDNDGIIDYPNVYVLNGNGAPTAAGGDLANGGPEFRYVEDADTVDITYGRASLLFDTGGRFNAQLSYQWQDDDIGARRQVTKGNNWVDGTEQPYGDYQNGAILLEPAEREVELAALELELDMGFATLSSSSSVYSHKGSSISDNTGFYAKNFWFTGLYAGTPRPMAQANRGYEDEAFVQELRLVSNPDDGWLDWVAGAYYMDQDLKASQDSLMPGWAEWMVASDQADLWTSWGANIQDQDFYYRRNQNFKDLALFGELTFHISDRLRATVGARWFDNEFTNDTVMSFPVWPGFESTPNFKTEDDDVLFKGNLSYDLTDRHMVYGTVSEGYRRGGANAVPLEGFLAEDPAYQQYDSDSVVNYELGVKGAVANHSYTLSAFYMDWSDPQLNIATYNWGFFAAVNGESARTQGLELELRGYLTDAISYNFGYAFVDAELTDDFIVLPGTDVAYVYAEKGARLPGQAEHALNLGLDYTHEFDSGLYWVTSLNGYYQSETENSLSQSEKFNRTLDGFSLWNLQTQLSGDAWDVTLYVKNLFNEEGVTGALLEPHMGTQPEVERYLGNSSKDYISLPRTIGAALTWRF